MRFKVLNKHLSLRDNTWFLNFTCNFRFPFSPSCAVPRGLSGAGVCGHWSRREAVDGGAGWSVRPWPRAVLPGGPEGGDRRVCGSAGEPATPLQCSPNAQRRWLIGTPGWRQGTDDAVGVSAGAPPTPGLTVLLLFGPRRFFQQEHFWLSDGGACAVCSLPRARWFLVNVAAPHKGLLEKQA